MSKKIVNNPVIWLYWENRDKSKPEPEIIRRCKECYSKYKNTIVLDENTIHDYLDDLVDCSRLEYLAQKSDYYRAKLLYEYGGIWIDMDMILLEDISYLYDELMNTNFEMCGNYEYIRNQMAFNISCMVFKPKSSIAEKWVKYDEEYILSNAYVDWATLGGFGLGKVVSENNYLDKVMPFPNIGFSLGYENKSYEKYYSMDDEFIKEKIDFIVNNKVKFITLYGTFMYNLKLEDGCLLDRMFKLKINNFFYFKDFEYFFERIKNNEHFKYSRYNDGEIIALIGKYSERSNCDGHQYFSEMSVDLNNALKNYKFSKDYILESGRVWYNQDYLKEYMDKLKAENDELTFLSSCFIDFSHNYNSTNFLRLLDELKTKKLVVVGPHYLSKLSKFFPDFSHIEVPFKNCYLSKDNIINSIREKNKERDDNFYLLSASMASNVIIDAFKDDSKNTYIDWGSIWDTFFVSPEYDYIVKRAIILTNYEKLKENYKDYLI